MAESALSNPDFFNSEDQLRKQLNYCLGTLGTLTPQKHFIDLEMSDTFNQLRITLSVLENLHQQQLIDKNNINVTQLKTEFEIKLKELITKVEKYKLSVAAKKDQQANISALKYSESQLTCFTQNRKNIKFQAPSGY